MTVRIRLRSESNCLFRIDVDEKVVLLQFASPTIPGVRSDGFGHDAGGKRRPHAAELGRRRLEFVCGITCESGVRPLTFWIRNDTHFLGKNQSDIETVHSVFTRRQ
jgi:hypothetical protein